RRWWRRWQRTIDPSRLVFIDETGLRTDMTRLRGRAPIGERLPGAVPCSRWRTSTLVAALDIHGVRCSMAMEGAMNAEAFELFIEQVLTPTLVPGRVVVLDNLASHRGRRVKQLIRQAGCRLVFLPDAGLALHLPYGYDLNPIELAFSKLKQLVRGAAARTVEALWQAAGRVANAITPTDAASYFTACGYPLNATHEGAPL
ncbi:MAG: IS630 family transposase, partial [Planctomycetota bacterium]